MADFDLNFQDFITIYPEFSAMDPALFQNYVMESFLLLGKYCLNGSVLPVFIYKCIAHLYQLRLNKSVGRTSSGSQGDTSVSLDYPQSGSEGAYWNQTPFGAFIYKTLILPSSLGGYYAL